MEIRKKEFKSIYVLLHCAPSRNTAKYCHIVPRVLKEPGFESDSTAVFYLFRAVWLDHTGGTYKPKQMILSILMQRIWNLAECLWGSVAGYDQWKVKRVHWEKLTEGVLVERTQVFYLTFWWTVRKHSGMASWRTSLPHSPRVCGLCLSSEYLGIPIWHFSWLHFIP